jgi:tetratricopeptide (TPR) repeat protein
MLREIFVARLPDARSQGLHRRACAGDEAARFMRAASEYRQWVRRGRGHQWNGRAIDAMLCFRRAQRVDPRASDAPFYLGEVLWQLGRVPDAIAAWRDAAAANGAHLAPNLALAEAHLGAGDFEAAASAADAALKIDADNTRASIIAELAWILQGRVDAGTATILQRVERERAWLDVPAIGTAVAAVLDRYPALSGRAEFLVALAQPPAALATVNPLLLALVIDSAARAGDTAGLSELATIARARSYRRDEHDALRRIAGALAQVDPNAAEELRARHAALVSEAFAPAVPLVWPIRSAGTRLRIIVVLPAVATTR